MSRNELSCKNGLLLIKSVQQYIILRYGNDISSLWVDDSTTDIIFPWQLQWTSCLENKSLNPFKFEISTNNCPVRSNSKQKQFLTEWKEIPWKQFNISITNPNFSDSKD